MILESLSCFELFQFINPDYTTPNNPCQNDGTCEKEIPPLDYTCECETGWGGKNCTIGKNNWFSIIL